MDENADNNSIEYENSYGENKNSFSSIERNNKNVYFTQLNFTVILSFVIIFVVCSTISIALFVMYLDGNQTIIYFIFIPLGILILASIITSFFPLFTKIIVDIQDDSIIIKQFKILFCFNKGNYITLNEVKQIIIEKSSIVNYENGVPYGAYNLIFIMNKDKQIRGLSGEIDKNYESQKLFEFLRESIPKSIPISSDLMEINEKYPNLNTQRIVGSTTNAYSNLNITPPPTALSFE